MAQLFVLPSLAIRLSVIFLFYLALLVGFGWKYYALYRQNPANFLFGDRLDLAQKDRFRIEEQAFIDRLEKTSEVLQSFNSLYDSGHSVEPMVVKPNYVLQLDSPPHKIQLTRTKGRRFTIAFDFKVWDGRQLLRTYSTAEDIFLTVQCNLDLKTMKVLTTRELTKVRRELEVHRHNLDSTDMRCWSIWDFLYFSGITLTTVGFGDILPNNSRVRRLVLLEVLLGVILLVVVLNAIVGSASAPCPTK